MCIHTTTKTNHTFAPDYLYNNVNRINIHLIIFLKCITKKINHQFKPKEHIYGYT